MNLRKNKAFTLIELLVVIAIIGILAALIIVSLSGARERAQDTQIKNNARNIDTAMAQFALDNVSLYPAYDAEVSISDTLCTNEASDPVQGLGSYLTGAAACQHANYVALIQTNGGGAEYAQAWELKNQSESTTTTGNGVYEVVTGSTTAGNLIVLGGGTPPLPNGRAFVTYGPQ